ncbi:nickel/cobalt transporter [Vibrio rhodolitus]|uniref:nickel/cobalt transporter n=1 Tax=Vibrio rhodolitus TaxID=2231649 RepID=UPI000E09F00D|nr:nickel/cobalt transporter [Vibrio rhodolitus]
MTNVTTYNRKHLVVLLFSALVLVSLYQLWVMWPSMVVASIQWQREVNAQLADLLYDAQSNPIAVGSYLVGFSFIYGMLHSLGPGHGKVIVTTYLATHPTKVKMSLMLTVISALFQALVAIVLVSVLVWGFHASMREVNQQAMLFVSMSYAFVALLGGVICCKAVKQLYRAMRIPSSQEHQHQTQQALSQAQYVKPQIVRIVSMETKVSMDAKVSIGTQVSGDSKPAEGPTKGSNPTSTLNGYRTSSIALSPMVQKRQNLKIGDANDASHIHSDQCGCGHKHVVDASTINEADTWREYVGIIATIGIRPCTGAIMVLLFANVVGLYWMGVVSALVMAAGTAFTTSIIALLTLTGKHFVRCYLSANSSDSASHWKLAGNYLQFFGGLLLIVIGLVLFHGQDAGISPVF